jgi:hypothetical protein
VRDANFVGVLQKKGMRSGRRLAWLAGIAAVATAVVACIELKGSDGSDCLRNGDCQSGVCSQLVCVAVPPVLELEAGPDAGADGSADGASGPETDGAPTPPQDGTAPVDGTAVADAFVADDGPEVPLDSAPDAIDESSPPDAPSDGPPDAPADARDDAGENG